MGDTEPSNKTLHKTKHTKSSILSCYEVGLGPVATFYHSILQVGWERHKKFLARLSLTA